MGYHPTGYNYGSCKVRRGDGGGGGRRGEGWEKYLNSLAEVI